MLGHRSRSGISAAAALLWAYAGLCYLFLYAPIAVVAVLSVNDSAVVGLPFRGATLKWFSLVFANDQLLLAIGNSLILGVVSTTVATTLALLMALGFRHTFPLKAALLNLILVPIIAPGVISGVILVVFFGLLDVPLSLWTSTLCAHITWVLPFSFMSIYPRIHGFDRSLEEAAMDLGASPAMVFRRILLPLIMPGVIAGALFSFSLSFDEFVRTLFLVGTDRTLPVQFWYMVVEYLSPEVSAMAVLIIAISVATSLLGFWFANRSISSATPPR